MSTIMKENISRDGHLKTEVRIIAERCAGCQECIIRCPTEALSMDVTRWIAKADNELCVGCKQCERTCPFAAIKVDGPQVVAPRTRLPSFTRSVGIGDITDAKPGFNTLEEAVKEAERCLNCPDPTCRRGCPAHNDIPGFIEAIRNKDLEKAQRVLSGTSCLPDICSRVCDWAKQCEGACSWSLAGGEPVSIGKLERFVTDNTPVPPVQVVSKRGERLSVGIVGSGPAGIAAAWELASTGASVTIYERDAVPGGVIRWGIPLYILPDVIAQRPIKALIEAGIKISLNTKITPETMERLYDAHDVVIAALGAPVPERPKIPGESLDGVIDATTFLTRARKALVDGLMLPEIRGASILVLGGSNTAIDVARNILRLGGKPTIIHRREERYSRARKDEIAEARREGVKFSFSTNIARLEGEDGKLKKVVLVLTSQKGSDSPAEEIKGSEHVVDVNMVILATGYKLDPQFLPVFGKLPLRQPISDRLLPDRRWQASGILAGENPAGMLAWEREYGLRVSMSPRHDKLWIVGDALIGPSTIVGSMAQGRMAALGILESYSDKK